MKKYFLLFCLISFLQLFALAQKQELIPKRYTHNTLSKYEHQNGKSSCYGMWQTKAIHDLLDQNWKEFIAYDLIIIYHHYKSILPAEVVKDIEASLVHAARWHAYYPKSLVTIPKLRAGSFYWTQLSKLASAAQPNQSIIELLGPRINPTSWSCLWMNLYIQLTYYTLGTTNYFDLEDNSYQLFAWYIDQTVRNASVEFQNDCSVIWNLVAYEDLNVPGCLTGNKSNDKELNLVVLPNMHHPRTGDNVRLREHIYLLIKRAFNVYLRISSFVKDGLYHIAYTYSDEYCNAKEISLNVTFAGFFFKTLNNCANRLKMDDPLLPKWEEVFSKIQDYHTDENGIMIGKDVSLAKLNRHYSHFLSFFLCTI